MSNEISAAASTPAAVRVLAVLLIAGGIVGIGLSLWITYVGLQNPGYLILALVFGALFVFTTWQGIGLWKDRPEGYRWARILFAAQVPAFSLGGLTYGFYTLLGFNLQIGSAVPAIDFNLGSAANAMYTPDAGPAFVGVNLVALAAFLYLLFFTRSGASQTAKEPVLP
jgi:uncharacterized membrane protein YiaA